MEENLLILLHLALILYLLPFTLAQQSFLINSLERSALLDLRSSLGLRTTEWPVKADPCTGWTGIRCQNGRVTGINISGFKRTRSGRLHPSFSVDALGNFSFLESFNASGFALPGWIPYWFGSQFGSLRVLDLRSSSVSGAIPSSLGNLERLNELYLANNDIAGSIPDELGQLGKLSILDLKNNSLTGQVPSGFALLSNLSRLDLSSNYLSGSVPSGLGNISGLQFLDMSDNSFTGSVPVELGNLSLLVELNFSKNSLSRSLPVELTRLRNLQVMDFGSNGLEGRLPNGLFSSLEQLEVMVLRGNRFDGGLPQALWSLPSLRVVDLSSNNFTGALPSSTSHGSASGASFNVANNLLYGNLPSSFGNFSMIDLSGNYFQGKVPDGGRSNARLDMNCLQAVANQRSLGDCRLFYAENNLSFDNFGAQEPTQSPLPEPVFKRSKRWIYILVGLFGGVGFITVLVMVIIVIIRNSDKTTANQRGTANVGPVPEGESPSLPKDPTFVSGQGELFTYEQLFYLTGEFREVHLIKHGHSGDIFRGFLEGDRQIVVKRINSGSVRKESYMMELELLSKCSNARLVPLLGHCFENENEKFLVYKYMPNGDLANSFYRVTNSEDDSLQSLDWITRLKIAIGAAEGLSYLHHECNPPLVHRDVQASSILLDDKFEVRLGSLSEIHVQEGDAHHNVLTRFLWKPQSSDPGPSGSSSATCSYDVYCFGKVLLELITGKLDISKSDDTTVREWLEHTVSHISIYDKELITKIVDPSLIVDEDLMEEVWAMAIVARSCLNPKPSKRPPMKYVLKALENPLKVVREENYSSGRLRTTSSRRSWSTAFFGSWRHGSLDGTTVLGQNNREGTSGLKQLGRVVSHGSGGIEHTISNKRLSNEIFPEPLEMPDTERQDEH